MAYDKRAMARKRVNSRRRARALRNGKNITDDDIPEKEITDCTNPIYTIEQ